MIFGIYWKFWLFCVIIPFLVAMILVFMVHPLIIRLARKMQILDRPDTRKLQEYPIPVLGGVAVIWGIIVGAGVTSMFFNSNALFPSVVAITVMLYIGLADDILGLSAYVRLLYEIAVIGFVVWMYQTNMNDFHGLFGIHELPSYLAYPLVFFAGAGIINSINMIDGVDGLSSGLCIMACLVFGIVFAFSHVGTMSVMCFLTAGALIPFFLHNVFGKQSKMFIGDSGTLMMGILMLIFTLHIVDKNSRVVHTFPTMGVVAFTISVMSVPIFDTLRVMIARILKGISPFKADKSHLHHLFIEIGFSHVGTSLCVYILNGLNILLWFVTWQLGFGPTVQFLVVVAVGVANTTGFYYVVRRMNRERIPYKTLKRLAEMSHFEPNPLYGKIRSILDRI